VAGINYSSQRPKSKKNIKSHKEKKFSNDTPENRVKYEQKLNARRLRKMKNK
jgi:hypothetical protein